ncbi:MAG: hypothetical protein Tsb0020_17630 [Haliangiales bacterium]
MVWTSEFEVPLPLIGRLLERKLQRQFTGSFRSMLRATERRIQTASGQR